MSSRPKHRQRTAGVAEAKSEWQSWTMIQQLYESSVKGLLPERQAQRMIQQYDEEQILLERRVAGTGKPDSAGRNQEGGHPVLSRWSRNTVTAPN
jgi:hypothetical protein